MLFQFFRLTTFLSAILLTFFLKRDCSCCVLVQITTAQSPIMPPCALRWALWLWVSRLLCVHMEKHHHYTTTTASLPQQHKELHGKKNVVRSHGADFCCYFARCAKWQQLLDFSYFRPYRDAFPQLKLCFVLYGKTSHSMRDHWLGYSENSMDSDRGDLSALGLRLGAWCARSEIRFGRLQHRLRSCAM